ncbi:MAG: threonine synthase, partial [Halobacteriales archaeon]
MNALSLSADPPSPPPNATDGVWLACIDCGATYPPFDAVRYTCDDCGGLLEVRYDDLPTWDDFEGRGVWRYADALPFEDGVSLPEGDTPLHRVPRLETDLGVGTLRIKHEGLNPTGSFKDRGMTVGVRAARAVGVDRLACASTGNTSAALAAYGGRADMETLVLLPAGNVAAGKVAQASLHGARILEVDGNFDDCLDLVGTLTDRGEAYLLNSLNPFRLEGQKTIGFEILEAFRDEFGGTPDWVVLPVGNAGNTAALFKGFRELVQAGALDRDEVPRLAGVQAEGAAPLVEAFEAGRDDDRRWETVETRATAIRIGDPVNAP